MPINNNILNQKGTPAFFSDIFANRPAFGYAGRVFISTDTGAIYEDTGSAWTLIADAGAGTTGTLQQVTTNGNTTTLGIQVQGIDINDGAGTGANNIAIGSTALSLNTTGANNTAIGYQSLNANTTGSANTGVGYLSLSANTTAGANTSIGHEALRNNTTGAQNTAVGHQSLRINTTGQYNVSVGQDSLANNIIGSNNTAIGQGSLRNNTTDGNVAVGYLSSNVNTTGVNNSSLGLSSLRLNTTGSNNTAIGSVALQNNTTADNNTAVGYASLTANTTGANNTAIGIQSLIANTTGTYNTVIGYNSGSSITTGSNNTILGSYLGTATLASNIVLSDGAGNVRLFSDANGLIGINQAVGSTIGGQLDIHSTQTYALVLNGLSTSNAYTAFSNASVGKWRIGNTYNAGANSFDIFNLGTSSTALSFNSTTNAATFNNSITASNVFINATTAPGLGSPKFFVKMATANSYEGILVASSSNNNVIAIAHTGTLGLITTNFGTSGTNTNLGFGTNGATQMTLDTSGNFGIGTSSPFAIADKNLSVDGTSSAIQLGVSGVRNAQFYADGSEVRLYAVTNMALKFGTNDTERMRITSSGDVGIGTTTIGSLFQVNGNAAIGFTASTAAPAFGLAVNGAVILVNLAGTGSRAVLADASGNLTAPVSDISVKQNIKTIGYGLNEIIKMNPVWFDYIDKYKNMGNGRQNGNIAQEMEKVIPEAVFTTPTTNKMGINYDQLHAVYIKAIQELNEKLVRNNIN